jgi:hypothetical protein
LSIPTKREGLRGRAVDMKLSIKLAKAGQWVKTNRKVMAGASNSQAVSAREAGLIMGRPCEESAGRADA